MFECDAKLSADGVLFLLHDDTLERTTNGQGIAGEQPWARWPSWTPAAGIRAPMPASRCPRWSIARFCLRNRYHLNIEIKPTPGLEEPTGRPSPPWPRALVGAAAAAADLLQARIAGRRPQAAPQLPRGLLLDTLWDGWLDTARQLGCVAMVCNHALWDAAPSPRSRPPACAP
jgi:glycerophosphoryl diester phosphodiesterase